MPKLWRKFFFFSHNFGNAIAEIVEEKKKNFPYFGNAIAEIVGEKKSGSGIAEIGREKKIL